MPFQNLKALTVKIPRKPITPLDRDHKLDVALACAFPSAYEPANFVERKEFERYIATSAESEIRKEIKEVLADLTDKERELLFR